MRRGDSDSCMARLNVPLRELHGEIVITVNSLRDPRKTIGADCVGTAVWLLPPWYWRIVSGHHPQLTLLTDFTASIPYVGWPRLIRAGEDRIPGLPPSHVLWTVKKGLLGTTIHDEGSAWLVLKHSERWVYSDSRGPSRREFRRMEASATMGHTRKEIRQLADRHGTAVAFGLRRSPDLPAFGCLSVHTQRGTVLSDEECDAVGSSLALTAPAVAKVIVETLHLPV